MANSSEAEQQRLAGPVPGAITTHGVPAGALPPAVAVRTHRHPLKSKSPSSGCGCPGRPGVVPPSQRDGRVTSGDRLQVSASAGTCSPRSAARSGNLRLRASRAGCRSGGPTKRSFGVRRISTDKSPPFENALTRARAGAPPARAHAQDGPPLRTRPASSPAGRPERARGRPTRRPPRPARNSGFRSSVRGISRRLPAAPHPPDQDVCEAKALIPTGAFRMCPPPLRNPGRTAFPRPFRSLTETRQTIPAGRPRRGPSHQRPETRSG
jgi:hypothetical protein